MPSGFGGHNLSLALVPSCRILLLLLLLLLAAFGSSGCSRERKSRAIGEVYVIAEEAAIRDRVGSTAAGVGAVRAGEKLEVLQRRRRWARIRTTAGVEGWLEERHLISPGIYEAAHKLVRETVVRPSQGAAKARSVANLHIDPERKSPRFFQLQEEEHCDVLEHRAVEKPLPPGTPRPWEAAGPDAPKPAAKKGRKAPTGPPMEDWFLVRAQGKAGWALARFFEMTIPDEVAQYAEGREITAWKILDEVEDEGAKKQQYLWATSETIGSQWDFDGIRVFTWNTARNRYETAWRERGLKGVYPVSAGKDVVDGNEVPAFSITVVDAAGNRVTKSYVLLGNIVRRK